MDNYEAIGVLKTLIDLNDSSYVIEALEMGIKSLQTIDSAQTSPRQTKICHEICLFKVDNKCNVTRGICLRKEINS